MNEPITNLGDAVAALGALPMPVGSVPQPMNAERLAAIAALAAAATPGPWWTESLTEHDGSVSIGIDAGGDHWVIPCQDLDPADAEFIAHARTDVSALLACIAELETAHPVMFRASHDSIVMGYYTSAAEARKHCETYVRREYDETTDVQLWWREDEDTVDQPEFGEMELIERTDSKIVPGPGFTRPTGYFVTPIEVSAKYDEGVDE